MAIDRLPSGSFRGWLMIDRQRYTATLPTEADARVWAIETRAAAVLRHGDASVTFAAYAEGWPPSPTGGRSSLPSCGSGAAGR